MKKRQSYKRMKVRELIEKWKRNRAREKLESHRVVKPQLIVPVSLLKTKRFLSDKSSINAVVRRYVSWGVNPSSREGESQTGDWMANENLCWHEETVPSWVFLRYRNSIIGDTAQVLRIQELEFPCDSYLLSYSLLFLFHFLFLLSFLCSHMSILSCLGSSLPLFLLWQLTFFGCCGSCVSVEPLHVSKRASPRQVSIGRSIVHHLDSISISIIRELSINRPASYGITIGLSISPCLSILDLPVNY